MSRAQLTSTVEQNTGGAVAPFVAGKNKIINGDFGVNQRGFTSTTTNGTFGFDRWFIQVSSGGTYSAQSFTPGTAPVAGYEGTYFARLVTTGQTLSSTYTTLAQRIEDVRTFAGQTVTISFWAKAASGTPGIAIELTQGFGSGGSTNVQVAPQKVTISTSWARYSAQIAVPSVAEKTLAAPNASILELNLFVSAGSDFNARTLSLGIQSNTFDIWGVQVEAGSVATPFTTATGTLSGELALCQRYYYRTVSGGSAYGKLGNGLGSTTTAVQMAVPLPVTMRTAPSAVDSSNLAVYDSGVTAVTVTALDAPTPSIGGVVLTCAGITVYRPYILIGNNNTAAYIGFSAEL